MAFFVEALVTFLFLMVILNVTSNDHGNADFAGGSALSHLWVYILAPEVGAILAAFCARVMGSED